MPPLAGALRELEPIHNALAVGGGLLFLSFLIKVHPEMMYSGPQFLPGNWVKARTDFDEHNIVDDIHKIVDGDTHFIPTVTVTTTPTPTRTEPKLYAFAVTDMERQSNQVLEQMTKINQQTKEALKPQTTFFVFMLSLINVIEHLMQAIFAPLEHASLVLGVSLKVAVPIFALLGFLLGLSLVKILLDYVCKTLASHLKDVVTSFRLGMADTTAINSLRWENNDLRAKVLKLEIVLSDLAASAKAPTAIDVSGLVTTILSSFVIPEHLKAELAECMGAVAEAKFQLLVPGLDLESFATAASISDLLAEVKMTVVKTVETSVAEATSGLAKQADVKTMVDRLDGRLDRLNPPPTGPAAERSCGQRPLHQGVAQRPGAGPVLKNTWVKGEASGS